ncbi:MAG: MoaD/ThiS family protein [Anaerolineales bacterium]
MTDTITVRVKLYALLRRHHPGPDRSKPIPVSLPQNATVADLTPALALPDDLVRAAFVNDDAVELDAPLHDGDAVKLFPPVVGGMGNSGIRSGECGLQIAA